MTRAIIENKKIVGYEAIKEEFKKPSAEEYERRQKSVAENKEEGEWYSRYIK